MSEEEYKKKIAELEQMNDLLAQALWVYILQFGDLKND